MRSRTAMVLVAAVALAAGACGDGGDGGKTVAGANPSSSANAQSGGGNGGGSAIAYSRCMRANGVPEFPDPDPQGGLQIDGRKVKMDSPAFKAAQRKCKKYDVAPPAEKPVDRKGAVAYAKCMRANGFPDFPDPDADGGTDIDGGSVDIEGPAYKKADEICRKHLAGGGRPPKVSGG